MKKLLGVWQLFACLGLVQSQLCHEALLALARLGATVLQGSLGHKGTGEQPRTNSIMGAPMKLFSGSKQT